MERNPLINLFVGYFKHPDPQRREEIDQALQNNLDNDLIDKVIIFDTLPDFKHDKIIEGKPGRPTYQDFFNATQDCENDINIIANSDIYFDESLNNVLGINDNVCYALTRHEYNEGNITEFNAFNGCPAWYSQDAWIFKGAVKTSGCDTTLAVNSQTKRHEEIKFTLGIPGCDQAIAHLIKKSGYILKNPSNIIIAIHLHRSRQRPRYSHRITVNRSSWGPLQKVPISGL